MTSLHPKTEQSRKLRADRKAAGLCSNCTKPAIPGLTYCADHQLANRRKHRQRLATLIRLGLCTRCGKQDAERGYKQCNPCRKARVNRTSHGRQVKRDSRRAKRADHRQRGICTDCDLPAVTGTTLCLAHLRKKRASADRRRKKLRHAGLCVVCGKPKQEEDRSHCIACRKRQAAYVAKQRRKEHHGSNEAET